MKMAVLTPPGARVDVAIVADPVTTTSHPVAAELALDAPLAETAVVPGRFADFCELVKARLTSLVLVTTLAGFYMGWSGAMDWLRLLNTLLGTALVAAGAAGAAAAAGDTSWGALKTPCGSLGCSGRRERRGGSGGVRRAPRRGALRGALGGSLPRRFRARDLRKWGLSG